MWFRLVLVSVLCIFLHLPLLKFEFKDIELLCTTDTSMEILRPSPIVKKIYYY